MTSYLGTLSRLLTSNLSTLLVLLFALVLAACYVTVSRRRRRPPGPWSLPLVGSLPFLSGNCLRDLHLTCAELGQVFGHVFSFNIGQQNVVVFNDFESAHEALSQHGEALAGRMEPYRVTHQLYRETSQVSSDIHAYTDEYRRQREQVIDLLKSLSHGKVSTLDAVTIEARNLAFIWKRKTRQRLDPSTQLKIAAVNAFSQLIWGHMYDHQDQQVLELVDLLDTVNLYRSEGLEADYIPALRWLPQYSRALRDHDAATQKLYDLLSAKIRTFQQQNDGQSKTKERAHFIDAYTSELRKPRALRKITQDWLMQFSTDMYVTGVATTWTTLLWGMWYMARNQQSQEAVYLELKAVLGRTKHPMPGDQSRLPYVCAALMEVQRMAPALPLAVPHCALQDIQLTNYTIPKHSQVLFNLYSIHRDPWVYDDSETFRPERFLDLKTKKLCNYEKLMPYSLGPRRCFAEQTARQTLFIFFATILHNFKISFPDNSTDLKANATLRLALEPEPFYVTLETRY